MLIDIDSQITIDFILIHASILTSVISNAFKYVFSSLNSLVCSISFLWLRWENCLALVSDICHEALDGIGAVTHSLDAPVRQIHLVFTCNNNQLKISVPFPITWQWHIIWNIFSHKNNNGANDLFSKILFAFHLQISYSGPYFQILIYYSVNIVPTFTAFRWINHRVVSIDFWITIQKY